jgi:hypothetical protein
MISNIRNDLHFENISFLNRPSDAGDEPGTEMRTDAVLVQSELQLMNFNAPGL